MGTAPVSSFFCAGGRAFSFFGGAEIEKRSSSETSLSNNPLDFGVGFDTSCVFVTNFGGGFPRNGSLNKSPSSLSSGRNGFVVGGFEVVAVVVVGSGDLREKVSIMEESVVCIKEWKRGQAISLKRKVGERKHIGGERK